MHNEQYEYTSLLRIFKKKNVIGTYYLNIHFSLYTSQQTNAKQLTIKTSKHCTVRHIHMYNRPIILVYTYIHTLIPEHVNRFFCKIYEPYRLPHIFNHLETSFFHNNFQLQFMI